MPHTISLSEFSPYDGWQTYEYPFQWDDAGRASAKDNELRTEKNDCTVRALAIALGLPYHSAHSWLAANGRIPRHGFMIQKFLNVSFWAKKISFQAVRGQRRMNPATFCKKYKDGSYICRTAKHVFAVKNGIVHDTFPETPLRCIYTAWEIDRNAFNRFYFQEVKHAY